VSTGAVALAAIVGVELVRAGCVEPREVVVEEAVDAVVAGVVDASDVARAADVPPPWEERTRATARPAAAATAMPAASRAFFTNSEATLARQCQNGSKSS
jgi:hypothetical protein